MEIQLSPEVESRLVAKAQAAGVSVPLYIERLLDDEEWEEDPSPPEIEEAELEELRRSMAIAMDQADRGESRPAKEVFAELRAKYGLPR